MECLFHDFVCMQEARSVPFVGDRLAEKIYEIVSRGGLRRLDNVDKEKQKTIDMFKNIHGVGLVTAQQFYAQVLCNIGCCISWPALQHGLVHVFACTATWVAACFGLH